MPELIPANVEVSVVIARQNDTLNAFLRPLVCILPDPNTWNDYGRNFFATLRIFPPAGGVIEMHSRLMFEGHDRSFSAFSDLLDRMGQAFPIELVDIPFVSLIPNPDHYRVFIETLGFEAGVSALRKMHDAIVVRIESDDAHLKAMIDSEDFHFGALRNGGAYDALRRGGRFFRQQLPQPVHDAASSFVFSARLRIAENLYTLPFNFAREGIFRDRISVLIGRNGVGKTQLLKSIIDGLHGDHPEGQGRPHFLPAFRPSRVLMFSSVPSDPFPRSIGAWHGIDYEYFPVNASLESGVDPLLSALVACRKSDDHTSFGENQNQTRMNVIEDALDPIGLWARLHLPLRPLLQGELSPGGLEANGLRYIRFGTELNEQNTIRLVQQIDWSRSAVVLDEDHGVRHLSSGEYAMLRLAAQATAAIEQGSLLLLDEPETHLHPNFISDMMEILDNLLQSTRSIAIIATHSAYVVRETPRERVNVLTLNDRQISIDTPRLQTFGATIDSISQFIFGDTSISHRYQKTLAHWADTVGREMGLEGIIARYGEELNSESLSFIARRLAEPPAPADGVEV